MSSDYKCYVGCAGFRATCLGSTTDLQTLDVFKGKSTSLNLEFPRDFTYIKDMFK